MKTIQCLALLASSLLLLGSCGEAATSSEVGPGAASGAASPAASDASSATGTKYEFAKTRFIVVADYSLTKVSYSAKDESGAYPSFTKLDAFYAAWLTEKHPTVRVGCAVELTGTCTYSSDGSFSFQGTSNANACGSRTFTYDKAQSKFLPTQEEPDAKIASLFAKLADPSQYSEFIKSDGTHASISTLEDQQIVTIDYPFYWVVSAGEGLEYAYDAQYIGVYAN